MKLRSLILKAFAFSLFVFLSSIAVWQALRIDDQIKDWIISQANPFLDSTLTIDDIGMRPNALIIRQIECQPSSIIDLSIEEIRVRFSLWEALKNRKDLKHALTGVLITHPVLTIHKKTVTKDQEDTTRFKLPPFPARSLEAASFLEVLELTEGQVVLDALDRSLVLDLRGRLIFEPESAAQLNLEGEIPLLPGGRIRLTGSADTGIGSFEAKALLEAADVTEGETDDSLSVVEIISGRVKCEIDVVGADSLTIQGSLRVQDAAFNLGQTLQIGALNLTGDLNGLNLGFHGGLEINGVSLPLEGMAGYADKLNWRAVTERQDIDVSSLQMEALGVPPLSGLLNLKAEIHSHPSPSERGWEGAVSLDSKALNLQTANQPMGQPEMPAKGLTIKDLHLRSRLTPEYAGIDTFTAQTLDGNLALSGSLDISGADSAAPRILEVVFTRQFQPGELGDWAKSDVSNLTIRGSLEHSNGEWSIAGSGALSETNEQTLIKADVALADEILSLKVYPPDNRGWLEAEVNLAAKEGNRILLNGENLLAALEPVLAKDFLSPELESYHVNLKLDGSLTACHGSIRWDSRQLNRSGSFNGDFSRREDGQVLVKGRLNLDFPESRGVSGPVDLVIRQDRLEFKDCLLTNQQGQRTLWVNGRLVKPTGNEVFSSDILDISSFYLPDSLDVVIDNFPVFDLLHSVKPVWARDVGGDLGASLTARGGLINFAAYSHIQHPRNSDYSLALTGSLNKGDVFLEKAALVKLPSNPSEPPHQALELSGRIDLNANQMDSVELLINRFSLGDLAQAMDWGDASDSLTRLDGYINGRMVAAGSLQKPDLIVDAHLTSGVFQGDAGYWANLQLDTQDSLYHLTRLDFGKDLGALLRAEGEYNRFDGDYSLKVRSDSIEIADALRMAGLKKKIVSGAGWAQVDASREAGQSALNGTVKVKPGEVGGLTFDSFTSGFNLTGLDSGRPAIVLDTAVIDWGDSRGMITGVIPLTKEAPLSMWGRIEGRLLSWLNRLEKTLRHPRGNGYIEFEVGGSIARPKLARGVFDLQNGKLTISEVVSKLEDMNIHIVADSSGKVRIDRFESRLEGNPIRIGNRFPTHPDCTSTIQVGGFDLGVLQLVTGREGVWLVIPSLMKSDWGGFFALSNKDESGPFEFFGPASRPLATGKVIVRNATFTFPFLKGENKPPSPFAKSLLGVLENMRWDAALVPERGCRYVNEISSFGDVPFLEEFHKSAASSLIELDLKIYVDLLLDEERDGLAFSGSLADTFRIGGDLTSSRGTIDYLDMDFKADNFKILFSPAELDPLLSGSAVTTIYDSTGAPREIRMALRRAPTFDDLTDAEESSVGGRWNELSLAFEDDQGHSQEQILSMMGYTPDHLTSKLTGLGGALMEDAVPIRRWTRALERNMQRWLGVDRFEIDPRVTRNLIERQLLSRDSLLAQDQYNAYLSALDQSSLTIGKYISRDVYVSYTGLLQQGADAYNVTRLGMVHAWDLMVWFPEIAPSLNLNYRYSYDSLVELGDNSLRIRYSFFLDDWRYARRGR